MPIILPFQRLRQEGYPDFKANVSYIVRSYLKNQPNKISSGAKDTL